MAALSKVFGVKQVLAGLTRAGKKHQGIEHDDVLVGYTANYALHVHENTETNKAARAKSGKKAKFLEDPTRTLANSGELGKLVTSTVRGGGSVLDGLLVAGLRMQRESQLEVPVDTGNLKASATTRKLAKGVPFETAVHSRNKRNARKQKQKKK